MPAPGTAREPISDDLPLEERIRQRAYELYLTRGSASGSEIDDWLQAEEEIQQAQDLRFEEGG
jgi:hypothetical protein